MKKMTKREMYEAIKVSFTTGMPDNLTEDMVVEFCDAQIAALDRKAVKAKEVAAKRKVDGDELTDAVRAALSETEFEPIADIVAKVEGNDVTVSKVTYRLAQLHKNGEVEKTDVTIPGGNGSKARKIVAYRKLAD